MQETEQIPEQPKQKRKRKINPRLKVQLCAVIERTRLTDRPDFKSIAARYGTTAGALRVLYHQWKRGEIDMGEPESPQEAKIDARVQHDRTIMLLRRVRVLNLDMLESMIYRAEDERGKAKGAMPSPETRASLRDAVRDLKYTMDLESQAEKGYLSILEELAAAQRRIEKPVNEATREVQTQIIHANDEERAMRALGLHEPETVSPETPSSIPAQNGSGA